MEFPYSSLDAGASRLPGIALLFERAKRQPEQRFGRGQRDGNQFGLFEKLAGKAAFEPQAVDHAVDGNRQATAVDLAMGPPFRLQKIGYQALKIVAKAEIAFAVDRSEVRIDPYLADERCPEREAAAVGDRRRQVAG